MKSIEVTAKTIDEAISEGLDKLGVAIGDVTVNILEEGSKGLFGFFGSRPAKVRLTLNEEENESASEVRAIFAESAAPKKMDKPVSQPAPKAEKKAPAEPAVKKDSAPIKPASADKKPPVKKAAAEQKLDEAPAADETKPLDAQTVKTTPAPAQEIVPAEQADRSTPAGKAQEFLQQVTKLMGVQVSVNVSTDEEGNVRVDMRGDTLGILIGRRGETLDALQYLTSLQVNKGESTYTRVTLDTENYRAKREEALVRLANRMANRAQKTGRRVSMEPMNPYERRILHSALQNNPAVETHSEGEEPNRHVVITLKQQSN